MRVLRTTRALPTETLTYEPRTGNDGQGKPAYDTAVSFDANVLEYDGASSRGPQFVIMEDGSRVETPLTLYVQGDATDVPERQDRVTLGDGRTFIVMEAKPVSGLMYTRAQPDHYTIRAKVE